MVQQRSPSRRELPVGIFDSGLGGLTVLRALRTMLPHEKLVFLGDTARVPYGTRSASTVVRYALACARQLLRVEVKFLVVACNTVSAVALPALRNGVSVPVLGVINPSARRGVAASRIGRVGVLATPGTVASGAYEQAIRSLDPSVSVFANAAPLLVPLVEEGWIEGRVPRLAVERYVSPLLRENVDVLVLGCTHYPLLRPVFEDVTLHLSSTKVTVVDSATATATEVARALATEGLTRPASPSTAPIRLLVTDIPAGFSNSTSRFLDDLASEVDVEPIDITVNTAGDVPDAREER